MRRPAESSRADYLSALGELEIDDDATSQAVARLLGFEVVDADDERGTGEPGARLEPTEDDEREHRADAAADERLDEPPDEPPPAFREPLPSLWRSVGTPEASEIDWLGDVDALPRSRAAEAPQPPAPAPLFRPDWQRGILTALLATTLDRGDVDVERIIRDVARGRALTEVPRLSSLTHARGVQVLVDRSETMMPFLSDLASLTGAAAAVARTGAFEVLRFAACPLRGTGPGPRRTWRDYRRHHTPAAGTRVLALTDLGIGTTGGSEGPAGAREWLDFADHLDRAGARLAAVVPYADRWPKALARRIPIVAWTHQTNAARAANAVRRRR